MLSMAPTAARRRCGSSHTRGSTNSSSVVPPPAGSVCCADADPAPLIRDWEQRVQLVVATSNDVLDNLLALLGPDGARKAFATPLVVVSGRMAAHARAAGFGRVLVAAGAGDAAIVHALAEACAHAPGQPHLLG